MGNLLDEPDLNKPEKFKALQVKLADLIEKGNLQNMKVPKGYADKETFIKDLKAGNVTADVVSNFLVSNEIVPKSSKLIENLEATKDAKQAKSVILDTIAQTHGLIDGDTQVKIGQTMDKFNILDLKLPAAYTTVEQFKLDLKSGTILQPTFKEFAALNKPA